MECFYENGLQFECTRCSFCCGHSPGFVYLSRNDLEKLLEFFKMPVKEFVEKYCRFVDYYYGETVLALKELKNFDCILWNNGCSAYDARPVQCSTYPFWSWMIKDKKVWDECSKDCPGINRGKILNKNQIEEQKKLYDENRPLKKEEVIKMYAQ